MKSNFTFIKNNKISIIKYLTAGVISYNLLTNTKSPLYYSNLFNQINCIKNNILSNKSLKCFSTTQNEISYVSYPANAPIEDRYDIKYLSKGVVFLSVLDGHGGHMLSEFANQRMSKYFEEMFPSYLKNNKNEDDAVKACLKETFRRVEEEFKEKAVTLYNQGEGRMATVGSCALICVIYKDNLYVANCGDSKARIITYDPKYKDYFTIKLMQRHNAEKIHQKLMLREKFPNDSDIVVCKRSDGTICYVKGRLQPTRSLGDFHLKYREFNESDGRNYKRPIKNFNGPYINAVPQITSYKINYDLDKFLVIATDGLGDFLNSKEVCDIVSSVEKKKEVPNANHLLDKVLEKAAEESGYSVSQLKNVALGRRRNLHDDTTILFVPLKK